MFPPRSGGVLPLDDHPNFFVEVRFPLYTPADSKSTYNVQTSTQHQPQPLIEK